MKATAFSGVFAAAALSAIAAPWFNAGIPGYDLWPSDGSDKAVAGAGVWSGTGNAALEGGALAVNAEDGESLGFTAASARDIAESETAVDIAVAIDELLGADKLPSPADCGKFAFSAALDNGAPRYFGIALDADGATNAWAALSGAVPADGTNVALTVRAKVESDALFVRYEIDHAALSLGGEEWIEVAAPAATELAEFAFAGGAYSVSDFSAATAAAVPPATLIISVVENASVTVTTNGVAVIPENGVYTVEQGSAVTVAFTPDAGYALTGPATTTLVVGADTELGATQVPTAVAEGSVITINEIMASNPSVDKGGFVSKKGIAEMDWVEFHNSASTDVDITGWYLSDNEKVGKETKAQILGSCVVPAGGYAIVWLDKIHTNAVEYAADEAFAILKLSSSGDLIQLADPGIQVVQKVKFEDKPQIKGYSYGPVAVQSAGGLVPGSGPFVYMKTATPGAANVTEGWGDFTPAVTFSEPHGWKTAPFTLELGKKGTNTTDGIYYTLDGSSPTTASTPYTGPITISGTTVIRAAVPDPNAVLQFETSATYLFLDDILAQGRSTAAPAGTVGFPDSGASHGQVMLYGLDQAVVNGADRARLLNGFTNSISTVSVVVDPAALFDASSGIYVNPRGEGREWERPTMLEFFDPKGVEANVSIQAGIRIRGGNSRNTNWPKHSLRFFFRSEYGESSLAAKMFLGESVKEAGEYDKIDLRTSQNLSWANAKSTMDTFVTEVFARDSQRDMGQPYTRSRYYNLFINGQYWGLYQTQERGDEHFGEAYLGGDSLQYDLIKAASTYEVNRLQYSIEVNEGTIDAWSNLWEIATQEGFEGEHADNYNRVLGLNPDGTRNPAYPILLNPGSLMSFIFSSHFMVDQDGPTSPFSSIDKGHANNFYALRNRDDGGDVSGFVFLRHDAEVSMAVGGTNTTADKDPTFWGTEEQENPAVDSPDPSGLGRLKFRTLPYFTPAELHYLLMKNPVYAREYADAFHRFFLKEGGPMTVEKSAERYMGRMAEIDDAIVCEQARWAQNSQTRSTWLKACGKSLDFITNRVDNMKSQYQEAGWYPTIDPPSFVNSLGEPFAEGDVVATGGRVYISDPAGGTVYSTLDGSDPLDESGQPTATAAAYTAEGFALTAQFTTLRARTVTDEETSALAEITLEQEPEAPTDLMLGIRVAGIMNACAGDGDSDDFIILTNTLDRAVSLADLKVVSMSTGDAESKASVAFMLGETNIAANGTMTLMANPWWFDKPQPAAPTKTCKLKNGDIDVVLIDTNRAAVIETATVSGSWWPIGNGADGKAKYACKQTGAHFVAQEFGAAVTQQSQWLPSFMPPLASSDAFAIVSAAAVDSGVREWLDALGATADGQAAISGFSGSAADLDTCYLVNIAPEAGPDVSLAFTDISIDAQGSVVVGGALSVDGQAAPRKVNGTIRLYGAATLEDLPAATDYVELGDELPVVDGVFDFTGNGQHRFFQLRIEK